MGLIHLVTLMCVVVVNFWAIFADLDTYIVHVESPEHSHTNDDLDNWYQYFLPIKNSPPVDEKESPHIVHSYHNVFIGFSAKLSSEDVKAMKEKPGFISASPEEILSLHTTHTPTFLGLHRNTGFWNQSNYGKGIIIGLLDTGIALNHPSFRDTGLAAPPRKWKGRCDGKPSACNNKLIGARSFLVNGSWPIDEVGHGTHTSSTAAGNFVDGANVLGNANGTAVGIAPLAHVAMYQVCNDTGCPTSTVLAGMDAAIDDGVDVLSLSLGGFSILFYADKIAIGAYSATKKGIFVSCSAGNNGPVPSMISNDAPWILTVGASTIDRKIKSTVVLGNNEELDGQSLYQPKDFPSTQIPLYYPGLNQTDLDADICCTSLKNDKHVKGKIVVCKPGKVNATTKATNVKLAGGVGIILLGSIVSGYTPWLDPTVFPAARVPYADGEKLMAYINSTRSPTAAIFFNGTVIGDTHAPQVAAFSSRGPSVVGPGILKPDILGPGVNILAAWPDSVPLDSSILSIWNVISGTSMSCPHLSGIAALLKSAHPDWSPAAIKSAMITTADVENLAKNPIEDYEQRKASIFAVGSGHVNPSKANNPGLVYDIHPDDYIPYLCGLNYSSENVGLIVQRTVNCTEITSIPQAQLNYPSFTVLFQEGLVQKYSRTVTNVGEADSVYTVKVVAPQYVNVTVNPRTLKFSEVNQKLTYDVTFTVSSSASNSSDVAGGSLTWSSNKHVVRSPIAAGNLLQVLGH